MTYVKINENLYPAKIHGYVRDTSWDLRESKAITLEMSYTDAMNMFVDDLDWAIVYQEPSYTNASGETIVPEAEVYDNSEYCLAGPVSDNRNGTVTVKMGKPTSDELLAVIMGG